MSEPEILYVASGHVWNKDGEEKHCPTAVAHAYADCRSFKRSDGRQEPHPYHIEFLRHTERENWQDMEACGHCLNRWEAD